MLVESIPATACVRKRSKRFSCVDWKNASSVTATCGLGIGRLITLYLFVKAPLMRPLLLVLFVVASFVMAL
jgi:hypothetical protein